MRARTTRARDWGGSPTAIECAVLAADLPGGNLEFGDSLYGR
ncbi:hypothetical protein [Burkholderia cepacia]|nr:hypothetical protein [Burkholderia cepacia]